MEVAKVPPQRWSAKCKKKNLLLQRRNPVVTILTKWSYFPGIVEPVPPDLAVEELWYRKHFPSWEVQWCTAYMWLCLCLCVHTRTHTHTHTHTQQIHKEIEARVSSTDGYTNYLSIWHWPHHLVFQTLASSFIKFYL